MSASCRECKRQVVILEGVGATARVSGVSPSEMRSSAGGREGEAREGAGRTEGARGRRGPVTSSATLSTDLGQRVVRFIYMHAVERGSFPLGASERNAHFWKFGEDTCIVRFCNTVLRPPTIRGWTCACFAPGSTAAELNVRWLDIADRLAFISRIKINFNASED